MKVWHWFPNHWPCLSFFFPFLSWHLSLSSSCWGPQATVFQWLIQLNMADTLTLHLNKQQQHIMISPTIMADWFDLLGGSVDLFYFMPIQMCVTTASICNAIACALFPEGVSALACMCVCVCVCVFLCVCVCVFVCPTSTLFKQMEQGLSQGAWSDACP